MFSRFFIDRPIFATVLSVVITLAGGIAVFTLPITQYPEIAPPTVEVSTQYPGANAKVVADTVAAPIEQQVNGVESMMYRLAGLIEEAKAAGTGSHAQNLRDALEEFASESSIAKVAGSEVIDYVIDENVQIHGGNGFVTDYPAERHYRDARVNRIFEGTNEINRLLIPGILIKRAVKGELKLIPAAMALLDEVMSPSLAEPPGDGTLEAEQAAVVAFRKVALLILGAAMQKYTQKINDEQEVLMHVADIMIDAYTAESSVLRALDADARRLPNAVLHVDAARAIVSDAAARIEANAKSALAAMADGDMLRTQLAALRRVLKVTPVNTVTIRRALADATVERGSYIFG